MNSAKNSEMKLIKEKCVSGTMLTCMPARVCFCVFMYDGVYFCVCPMCERLHLITLQQVPVNI